MDVKAAPNGVATIEDRILRITGYYGYYPGYSSQKSKTRTRGARAGHLQPRRLPAPCWPPGRGPSALSAVLNTGGRGPSGALSAVLDRQSEGPGRSRREFGDSRRRPRAAPPRGGPVVHRGGSQVRAPKALLGAAVRTAPGPRLCRHGGPRPVGVTPGVPTRCQRGKSSWRRVSGRLCIRGRGRDLRRSRSCGLRG